MSIERQHGKVTLMCDRCDDIMDDWYRQDQFDEMMIDAKDSGWMVAKEEKGWAHLCPDCLKISLKH